MTEVYIVRHCEAQGNVKRIFQGVTDLDISETGAKQLEYLAERFKDIKVDKIYASPLKRAFKTAQAIANVTGGEVVKDERFTELNGGVLEGRLFKQVFEEDPVLADTWDNHPQDFAPLGGEKMRDAYERIYDAVLDIAKKNKGKTVAIASHGGAIRCFACRLLYGDITRLKDTAWSDNTGITLVRFDDDFNPQLIFYNDSFHVPKQYLPKRNRLSSFIGDKS